MWALVVQTVDGNMVVYHPFPTEKEAYDYVDEFSGQWETWAVVQPKEPKY